MQVGKDVGVTTSSQSSRVADPSELQGHLKVVRKLELEIVAYSPIDMCQDSIVLTSLNRYVLAALEKLMRIDDCHCSQSACRWKVEAETVTCRNFLVPPRMRQSGTCSTREG